MSEYIITTVFVIVVYGASFTGLVMLFRAAYKAVDTIHTLRSDNADLVAERDRLRELVDAINRDRDAEVRRRLDAG